MGDLGGRMILLDKEKIINMVTDFHFSGETNRHILSKQVAQAQAKEILIELQLIYKLPDLKMEHDRMGEFIQELEEEIE